jgi:hypothetical protein
MILFLDIDGVFKEIKAGIQNASVDRIDNEIDNEINIVIVNEETNKNQRTIVDIPPPKYIEID